MDERLEVGPESDEAGLGADAAVDRSNPDEYAIEKRWLLLARVDSAEFIHFYDKYYESIFSLLYRRSLLREVAEDLCSETFYQALRNLRYFRWQGVTMGAWLYRIACNQLRTYQRCGHMKRGVPAGAVDVELTPSPRPVPLERMLVSEEQRLLSECLQELEMADQDVLSLHYWQGLTTPQVAAILGQKEGTVRSRLLRGRRRLRRLVEERHRVLRIPTGQDEGEGTSRRHPPRVVDLKGRWRRSE